MLTPEELQEEQLRTALRHDLGPHLAELRPASTLLTTLARRQQRRTRLSALAAAATVAALLSGVFVLAQRPVAPAPIADSTPTSTVTQRDALAIVVPDVRGMSEEQGTQVLQAAGLAVDAVTLSITGASVVVAQSPAPGSEVRAGSTVTMTIGLAIATSSASPSPSLSPSSSLSPTASGLEIPLPVAASGARFGSPTDLGGCPAPGAAQSADQDTFVALTGCGVQLYGESGALLGYLLDKDTSGPVTAEAIATTGTGELYMFRRADDSAGAKLQLLRWTRGKSVVVSTDVGSPAGADDPTSAGLVGRNLTAAGPYVAWSRDVAADPVVTVDIQVLDTRSGRTRTIPVSKEPYAKASNAVTGLDMRADGAIVVAVEASIGPIDVDTPPHVDIRVLDAVAAAFPSSDSRFAVKYEGCRLGRSVTWIGASVATTGRCGSDDETTVTIDPVGLDVLALGPPASSVLAPRRASGFYAHQAGDMGDAAVIAVGADGRRPLTVVLGVAAGGSGDGAFVSDVAAWGFSAG